MADSQQTFANGKRPSGGHADPGRHKHPRGRGRGQGGPGRGRPHSTRTPAAAPSNGQQGHASGSATPLASESEQGSSGGDATVNSHLSDVRFASYNDRLDPRLLASVPFEFMSVVQAATVDAALSGVDVLAAARTGTGKTLAFLIPVIQRLTQMRNRRKEQVYVLVLSPTRELAIQIQREADMLLRQLKDIGVQHVVGGTNMSAETKRLTANPCNILVATPGRLLDHLNNGNLSSKLSDLCVLVLDEADRMLDMGFRNELEQIKARLPDRRQVHRQSLLFSATYPKTVLQVADVLPNHQYINTIPEEEQNTHEHVPQVQQVVPMHDVLPATLAHVLQERQNRPGQAKIIAFFPTARATGLAYEVLSQMPGLGPMWEIHSRRSQGQRARASDEFRKSADGILFSSDVAARGVDFPNVSMVIQSGLPSSSDQYIHRLGRTARAGAAGRGVLILADYERFFLSDRVIKSLPLQPLDAQQTAGIEAALPRCRQITNDALARVSPESKAQAYQAALGYYNSSLKSLRWTKGDLVQVMNRYASECLLYPGGNPPGLLAKTVGKMGLRGVPGINVVSEAPGGPSKKPRVRGLGPPRKA
ncbi:unnamed protein product [Parajaminaea phylloscopi]